MKNLVHSSMFYLRQFVMISLTILAGFAIAAPLFLAGCGGGGSTTAATNPNDVSVGAITGFGSVYVNGMRFDTSNAKVIADDVEVDESALEVGMIVTVMGDHAEGVADEIEVEETVKGPIESIDPSTDTLVVLGQTVLTDEMTVFHETDFLSLMEGTLVEVSGLRNDAGEIVASFIELEDALPKYKVIGSISDLDTSLFEFKISGLTVNYSAANLTNITDGVLSDGMLVSVKGDSNDYSNPPPYLVATKVQQKHAVHEDADEGSEIEIEGYVTVVTSATEFEINGIPVSTDDNTRFEGGVADDIQPGVKLEVEGYLDDNGVLQADEVEFKFDNDVKIEADIEAIDADNGTITLLGITVAINDQTRVRDDRDEERMFDISDLAEGDRVEVKGYVEGDVVIATRLERDEADTSATLQGPVDAFDVNNMTVTLLGITVSVDAGTEYEIDEVESVLAGDFFGYLAEGMIVKVKWDPFVDVTGPATELEIESEDGSDD